MGFERSKFIVVAAAAALLAGCGDPASQAPVGMEPGNYEITVTGSMFGMKTEAQSDGSRCVTNAPEHIPTALLRPYLALNEQCATAKFERTGNKLTGSSLCQLEDGVGTATVHFDGTVAADTLDGTLRMEFDLDMPDSQEAKTAALLLKAASIPFSAKRTGDCTGNSAGAPGRFSSSTARDESSVEADFTDFSEE